MSAAANPIDARPRLGLGLFLGLLGVIAFSLTLPMTRYAVAELDPWFLAFGRMSIAGAISALLIVASGVRRPAREDWPLVLWTSVGVVIGFPLMSSLAMKHIPANHGAIINGALPFATALLAARWFGERHSRRFWSCAAIGSALVIAFALRGGGAHALGFGEAAMLAAVVIGAVGYVAGGRLSARLGGIAVILWALAVALPVTAPITLALVWSAPPHATALSWAAFGYVTLVSQLIGFFAWYNGMALGGIARVGQVQLLQAFFTIGFAALLFGERVEPMTWLFAAAVVATIAIGRTGRRRSA
jgi:drug/metabolite transporter (DMT)-like permease